jgi:hypothetical protein
MALNIENEETTHRLAQELAALTGESMSVAAPSVSWRSAGDCASCLKEPWRSGEVGNLLHGERGLPR